jgi:predicted peroxiredoxin
MPFERHLRGFPDIAKDAKQRGIEILNCSQESVIKEFRKVTVQDCLNNENKN